MPKRKRKGNVSDNKVRTYQTVCLTDTDHVGVNVGKDYYLADWGDHQKETSVVCRICGGPIKAVLIAVSN